MKTVLVVSIRVLKISAPPTKSIQFHTQLTVQLLCQQFTDTGGINCKALLKFHQLSYV